MTINPPSIRNNRPTQLAYKMMSQRRSFMVNEVYPAGHQSVQPPTTQRERHSFAPTIPSASTAGNNSGSNTQRRRGQRYPKKGDIKAGPWLLGEKLQFLEGLLLYGTGQWIKISKMIRTRSLSQVRSHAQYVMKQLNKGVDVLEPLKHHCHPRRYEALVKLAVAEGTIKPFFDAAAARGESARAVAPFPSTPRALHKWNAANMLIALSRQARFV